MGIYRSVKCYWWVWLSIFIFGSSTVWARDILVGRHVYDESLLRPTLLQTVETELKQLAARHGYSLYVVVLKNRTKADLQRLSQEIVFYHEGQRFPKENSGYIIVDHSAKDAKLLLGSHIASQLGVTLSISQLHQDILVHHLKRGDVDGAIHQSLLALIGVLVPTLWKSEDIQLPSIRLISLQHVSMLLLGCMAVAFLFMGRFRPLTHN